MLHHFSGKSMAPQCDEYICSGTSGMYMNWSDTLEVVVFGEAAACRLGPL